MNTSEVLLVSIPSALLSGATDELMVSPLILVHPAEQHVQQINQRLLLQWEAGFVVLQISYYLV